MAYEAFAFISYSRKDLAVTRQLQADIESYHIPTRLPFDRSLLRNPKYLRPIVRDQTDLEYRSQPFWNQLEAKLATSRYLVLMCSTDSARSEAVNREVEAFLATHPNGVDDIVLVIVNGDIQSKDGPQCCLPLCLLPHQQVLAARDNPHVKDCNRLELKLKTISALLQVSFATLFQKHRYRRNRNLAVISICGILSLALFLGLAVYAIGQKNLRISKELAANRAQYIGEIRLAAQSLEQGSIAQARQTLDECDATARDWEWGYLDGQLDLSTRRFSCAKAPQPVAATADGRRIAVCGADKHVRVYNVGDYKQALDIAASESQLTAVAWSHDGKIIAASSESGEVNSWNATTGEKIATNADAQGYVGQLQFMGDSTTVLCSTAAGGICRIDVASGQLNGRPMSTVNPAGKFSYCGGDQLAALDVDGRRLRVFDITTPDANLLWETSPTGRCDLTDIDLSPDGRRLLSATGGEGVAVLETSTGRKLATIGAADANVTSARWLQGSGYIGLALESGTVEIYTYFPAADKSQELKRFVAHPTKLSGFSYIDYGLLLSGSLDGAISLWTCRSGEKAAAFTGHQAPLRGVAQIRRAQDDRDAKGSFVTWSDDGTARVWTLNRQRTPTGTQQRDQIRDMTRGVFPRSMTSGLDGVHAVLRDARFNDFAVLIKNGLEIGRLQHGAWVGQVAFSPDVSVVLTAALDGSAALWSVRDGSKLFDLDGHAKAVRAVGFSHNGNLVGTGDEDGDVRIWTVDSGEAVGTISQPGQTITALALDLDGEMLVTGTEKGAVRLWERRPAKHLADLAGHEQMISRVQISRDAQSILSCSAGETRLWDATRAARYAVFETPAVDAALNPSGSRVATMSAKGVVGIWEAATGELIMQIPLQVDQGVTLQFNSDGSHLIATGGCGEIIDLAAER